MKNILQSPPLGRCLLLGLTCLALADLAFTATPVHAATVTWTGADANPFWVDDLNWDSNIQPVGGDDVIINGAVTVDMNGLGSGFLPSGAQVLLTNGATLMDSAGTGRIQGSTTLTVASNCTINLSWLAMYDSSGMSFENGAIWTSGVLQMGSASTFSFKLGTAGFTKLTPSTIYSATVQTWNVDMSAYTGGPTNIILMQGGNGNGYTASNFWYNATKNVTGVGIYTNSTVIYDHVQSAYVLVVSAVPVTLAIADFKWVGLGADNHWLTAANWNPALVPGNYQSVDIDGAYTVNLAGLGSGFAPYGAQILLTNGATLINSDGTGRIYGPATLNVSSNCTINLSWLAMYDSSGMSFENGAIWTSGVLQMGSASTFSFKLGTAGFTKLTPSTIYSATVQTWNVDMSAYTGGPTNIILMQGGNGNGYTASNFWYNATKNVTGMGVYTNSTVIYDHLQSAYVLVVSSNPVTLPTGDFFKWTGGGGDNQWTNAANWYPQLVPGANQSVIIDGVFTVDLRGFAYGFVPSGAQILLTNGATLTDTISVCRMNGNSTVNVSSNCTVNDYWAMYSGSMSFQSGAIWSGGQDWEFGTQNTFSFQLGSAGFTTLAAGAMRGGGDITTETFIADMANYTGGPGIVNLVTYSADANSFAGGNPLTNALFQTAHLIVTNAAVGYTANLQYDPATRAIQLNVTAAPGYATYYWDNNGATAGFGTAGGTWASPTTGNASQGWSTDGTGATLPVIVTTGVNSPVNFGNGVTGLGAGTITVSGTVTNEVMTIASGSGAIVFSGGTIKFPAGETIFDNNTTNTISSVLAGTSLTKSGGGILTLSAPNTYTGGTTVSGGVLNANNGSALGTGSSVTVANGASLAIAGGITITNSLNITGGGTGMDYGAPNVDGAFLSTGTNTVSGLVTLSGGARLATVDTNSLTLTGGVTNGDASDQLFVGAFVINNKSINFGTNNILFAGDGGNPPPVTGKTILLNVAGNVWNNALFFFAGIVKLGVDNAMPASGTVTMGFLAPAYSRSTLDLNGHNQTVASINTYDSTPAVGDNISITGGGILTVNQSVSTAFSGIISDGATHTALIKAGAGTLTLSGANTYKGNTTVNGGTLAISQATIATNSTITVATGATLELDFAVTNTVTSLVLGNTNQAPGVYNSGNSGGFITGTGSLRVPSTTPAPTSITYTVSGSLLTLNWPSGQGWILQSNSVSLANSNAWQTVTGATPPFPITKNPANPAVFYRLKY